LELWFDRVLSLIEYLQCLRITPVFCRKSFSIVARMPRGIRPSLAVVDHLSRTGDIRLTSQGMGKYHVNLHTAQHSQEIYA
jgi:hypothetical protein